MLMRDEILKALQRNKKGATLRQLRDQLGLKSSKEKKLKKELSLLEKSGLVLRKGKKYYLASDIKIVRGRFENTHFGYGFLVTPKGDYFIPRRFKKDAMHGDLVEAIVFKGREGKIIRVVERKRKKVTGFFVWERKMPVVIPVERKLHEIEVKKIPMQPIRQGDLVEAQLAGKKCVITDVIGDPDEPGNDVRAILTHYEVPVEFPELEIKEAEEKLERKDLRGEITFTIDGETAKDFDDAVSIKKTKGGYIIGIHIADVSHYVLKDTPLDAEAQMRGNSIYFPELAIPMLPPMLSENLSSLRPDEDRYTMTVEISINRAGEIRGYRIFPSIIRSRERMTYTKVWRILQGDKKLRKRYAQIVPKIELMAEAAELLLVQRRRKGSIDFDLPEPSFLYTQDGVLLDIMPAERNFAHQIIEEFMLAANEVVARYLTKRGYPTIYRIHEPPEMRKIESLKKILQVFGYELDIEEPEAKALQKVLELVEGKTEEKLINLLILRSMKLAKYSPDPVGHFALAKEHYLHFTSPIRRYPDLVVHRTLKAALAKQPPPYDEKQLEKIAAHSSMTERRADQMEAEIIQWRTTRFLQDKIGEKFQGTIVGVSNDGLQIELDKYLIQGTVLFSDMREDYFVVVDGWMARGKRSGKTYKIGQRVNVTLGSVDPYRRLIYFLPEEMVKKKRKKKKTRKKNKVKQS